MAPMGCLRPRPLFIWTTILIIINRNLAVLTIAAISSEGMFGRSPPSSLQAPLRLRVVSYNVLSPLLASPCYFTSLKPEHLVPASRLAVILRKLENEMSYGKVVICLQEVCYDWAGEFHAFFANRGYHMVAANYGNKHSGYMGVALAWPTKMMQAEDVRIARLSDSRDGYWPEDIQPSLIDQVNRVVTSSLTKLGLSSEKKEPIDHWNKSRDRFNSLVTAKLRDNDTGRSFCVGTYHMPCMFYAPMVMTIHADMAFHYVQTHAKDLPCVLAGDFNIKPKDSTYRYLLSGMLSIDDPAYPTPKNNVIWEPSLIYPMRSAYGSTDSGEPDFTNFAQVGDAEPFIDTLDYIFLSDSWSVVDTALLRRREQANGPYPNLDDGEASDHLLIAATLESK